MKPFVLLPLVLCAVAGSGRRPDPGAWSGQVAVEIVAPDLVSPELNQTFPAEDPVTGDLWFSVYEDSFDDQTIMVARRSGDDWSTPEVAPFSGTWGDRAPRFSPDGSRLYITSNRPRPGQTTAGDMNVWRLDRTAQGWSEPVYLEPPVNSGAADFHPSVTASGLWVPSQRGGGLGRSDLFRIGDDGSVLHPGRPLNDEFGQPDVWVSPDESWMILAITDHPDGFGGDDLYVARREGDGWTRPVNLGPAINTSQYEYGPNISADGEYVLFTSHRAGPSRIYRVSLQAVLDASG